MNDVTVRSARPDDHDALWSILDPVISAGETYPLPSEWTREQVLAYWLAPSHQVFVAEKFNRVVGTYYMRPNNLGRGAHIANCGYVVTTEAQGCGVAKTMCTHSLNAAREAGYKGMQFNFVIANNLPAIALWEKMGFKTIARLPNVYDHPREGMVDALVMFQPFSD